MTRVKICGLTRLDDALAAAEAGADLLGFVLVPSSPRYVTPARAAEIAAALRGRGAAQLCVGVVAGLPLAQVRGCLEQGGFDLLQVHGEEAPALAAALYPRAILAIRVTGPASLEGLANCRAFACLLDARDAERREQAAAPWDWSLLKEAGLPGRAIVAGGLHPGNVAQAVRVARPWGVDVASGVEASPGRKDRGAMARFVQAVREVDADARCSS